MGVDWHDSTSQRCQPVEWSSARSVVVRWLIVLTWLTSACQHAAPRSMDGAVGTAGRVSVDRAGTLAEASADGGSSADPSVPASDNDAGRSGSTAPGTDAGTMGTLPETHAAAGGGGPGLFVGESGGHTT
jgi:hypothetical protein